MHGRAAQRGADGGEVRVGQFTELPTQTCEISVPGELAPGTTSPGRGWPGDERLELVEHDRLALVVVRAGLGRQRGRTAPRAPAAQPLPRALVGPEHTSRRPRLDDHVADRGPLGHRQAGHAVPVELEDAAHAAAHAVAAQELEHDVLGLHPRGQAAAQLDSGHPRTHSSNGRPAMATATSPPTPTASMASAPAVEVCESAPIISAPGRPKRSGGRSG